MRKRTRRFIFFIATVVFLMGSYAALVYAQGYKYSFSEKEFFRTGAISLKANVDGKVFINDRLISGTSFLGTSFSKGGLLPGQYRVRVERDDFSYWQKIVVVKEGLITEFPKIILIPQSEIETPKIIAEIDQLMTNPNSVQYPTPKPTPSLTPTPKPTPKPTATPSEFISGQLVFRSGLPAQAGQLLRKIGDDYVVLGNNVLGFAFSSSNNKVMFWTNNDLYIAWLAGTNYQPLRKDGDIEKITHFSTPIIKAVWFRDEDHIAVDSHGYKIVEIDTRGGVNIIKI